MRLQSWLFLGDNMSRLVQLRRIAGNLRNKGCCGLSSEPINADACGRRVSKVRSQIPTRDLDHLPRRERTGRELPEAAASVGESGDITTELWSGYDPVC